MNNLLTAQNGRVLVGAAGNAGNIKYHVKTTLTNSDTLFTWVNVGNTTDFYYFTYADTTDIKNVQMRVGVNRPSSTDLVEFLFIITIMRLHHSR